MNIPNWIPLSLIAAFAVVFVGRSIWVWMRVKKSPFSFGRSDSLNDFMGIIFRITFIGAVLFLIFRTIWPSIDQEVGEIRLLAQSWIEAVGLLIIVASLLWAAIAEFQMGAFWRIGIPTEPAEGLVSSGLFSVSRNPVFLGMLGMAIGLFLAIPTAVTFSALAVFWLCFSVQIRLEEAYLQRTLGAEYADFCSRVRRWL